ncbi:unnamed protein product [Meloidogyne enterolobii]|uniref:Uncharacterized protein n=1 Tax=Meloidogyne enterolobii TaxID=390850 RepID=A0ACB0YLD1_MELEN
MYLHFFILEKIIVRKAKKIKILFISQVYFSSFGLVYKSVIGVVQSSKSKQISKFSTFLFTFYYLKSKFN